MLQKLQIRAARIVTNSSYDAPATNLIKELKWPTVHDMIKQEMATIVFKSISGLAPTYLSTLSEADPDGCNSSRCYCQIVKSEFKNCANRKRINHDKNLDSLTIFNQKL